MLLVNVYVNSERLRWRWICMLVVNVRVEYECVSWGWLCSLSVGVGVDGSFDEYDYEASPKLRKMEQVPYSTSPYSLRLDRFAQVGRTSLSNGDRVLATHLVSHWHWVCYSSHSHHRRCSSFYSNSLISTHTHVLNTLMNIYKMISIYSATHTSAYKPF